jgi:hypothetical protein
MAVRATPRRRFDVARLPGIVLQNPPELPDHSLQDRFADELVAPDSIQQGALRHEHLWLAGQRTQHLERLGRQRYRLSAAGKACIGFIELERAKAKP